MVRPPRPAGAEELAAAGRAVERADVPRKDSGEPDRNWAKELPLLRARLAARDWPEFLEKGLGKKVATGLNTYQRREIPPELVEALEVFVREAAHQIVAEVARFNAAAFAWLERFEASFDELKAEERAYRFEDLPKALHPRDESRLGTAADVWYRLDGRIDQQGRPQRAEGVKALGSGPLPVAPPLAVPGRHIIRAGISQYML